MNITIKTNRPDEKTWEHYRTKIESLYWEASLDKIDAHMKKHHGFIARYVYCRIMNRVLLTLKSKSQYERHFRTWKLRKNLTTDEWVTTIRYLKKNSIRLEQVEVLFKGREITQGRILQEIARRNSLTNTLYDGMLMSVFELSLEAHHTQVSTGFPRTSPYDYVHTPRPWTPRTAFKSYRLLSQALSHLLRNSSPTLA